MLEQGFVRVKGQAQITKCYFLWVDAINMQALSGHYLIRQQAPMVFSLYLVHLSTAVCIFWNDKVGSMLAQGFLRVKSQVKITKCYFLWVGAVNFAIIEWPPFIAPTSTHGVFTSFSLSRCCCLHFCRNKFGLMLAQRYFKGQMSFIIRKLQLFMTLCDMQSSSGNYSMCHQVPMVSLLLKVYLSAVAYIFVEITLGSFGAGIF